MSVKGKSGNGRIGKYNRQVAEKAGLEKGQFLAYAPDFLDSLVRRMAIPVPGEIAERCLAWLIYRAGGNQSLKAIHLYSEKGETPIETELWQSDCALDLAWLEAGYRAEWLDAPRDMFQAEAKRRGVKPIDKSVVSRGFQFNRLRGSMECETGYALVYVPAPDPTSFSGARETCRRKGESLHKTKHFTEWARFSYAREFEEYTVARATERRLLRFLTATYKNANGSGAPETDTAPSLEALEPLESLEATPLPTPAPPAAPVAVSSSSKPYESKKEKTPLPSRGDDDEKPKPEYASARDEVKAIYHAKTGTYPTVQLLDRIEGINTSRGETWDSYLGILKPHLGGNWDNPGGFLTWLAKTGFEPVASPPQEKPKPKCPRCHSDNQRGAILLNDEIVPCPDCSTSAEWRDELAGKMKRPAMSKGA